METYKASQRDASAVFPPGASFPREHDQPRVKDVIANYERLKAAIAKRQVPTAEHSIRVRIHATSLGFACRLTGSEITTLSIAAEIHDIGKLQVPSDILEKPGPLSQAEWSVIQKHPIWGARIAALSFPSMPEVARCVALHHERLDGTGYPNALSGSGIPILVRIMAVADAYSALTEERAFRPAFGDSEALRILMHEEAGRFDEFVVEMLARSHLSH